MPTPNVAIIDCGAGNLHSVRKAFASQMPEGATLDVVTEASALKNATHIVLPGVGAFADCMRGFAALPGMRAALEDAVLVHNKPFLGICVGMQMLFKRGHEHGTHEGLGWFDGEVRMITPADPTLRIPHMGWNRLQLKHERNPLPIRGRAGVGASEAPTEQNNAPLLSSPLLVEACPAPAFLHHITHGDYVYFVPFLCRSGCNRAEVLATVDYGGEIVALIGRDNIMATQFHPEKSQATGLRMIQNFLNR